LSEPAKIRIYNKGEHRLMVFEYRVLKGIFGPKRDEVTGGWRKLNNEELRVLYSSTNIITMFESMKIISAGHGREEECV
jgi:hypothetical protein